MIEDIWKGFNYNLIPKLTDDGTSGAYRFRNEEKENIAIFKPIDEEPFAPNNPRGHLGPFGSQTFRPGVLSGESCIREVAAFMLDHGNFSGVPMTTFVEVVHPSLKYVPFSGLEVTSDFYYDVLSTIITPVNQEDHKLRDKTKSGIHLNLSTSITEHNKSIGVKLGSLQQFVKS